MATPVRPVAARISCIVAALLLTTGCSTFNRDFRAAAEPGPATSPTSPTTPVEGAYEGTWTSEAGHGSGKLQAILTRTDGEQYLARFRATYWGLLTAEYSVPLTAAPAPDGALRLQGEKDLGFLAGGVYRYDGTLTPARLDCRYESKHDRGLFQLTRPPPSTPPP